MPENVSWIERHFRDNGLDPGDHWIVPLALSYNNDPVYFPIGSAGVGIQNCVATNGEDARVQYADLLINSGRAEEALKNLLLRNTTGIHKTHPGTDFATEIKSVSAGTLKDILGPFECVDYLESDIQQSEILVFPPFLGLLHKKVRRIHIGTHGRDVHRSLHELFKAAGWTVVFSYEPNSSQESELGPFTLNDGILTLRNPDL